MWKELGNVSICWASSVPPWIISFALHCAPFLVQFLQIMNCWPPVVIWPLPGQSRARSLTGFPPVPNSSLGLYPHLPQPLVPLSLPLPGRLPGNGVSFSVTVTFPLLELSHHFTVPFILCFSNLLAFFWRGGGGGSHFHSFTLVEFL